MRLCLLHGLHTLLCLCALLSSVLQLQARMRANMGPAFDRVIFYPRLPNSDTFMSFISVVDVLLHPFPFDGSKTSADGLAMGIPVVTWPSVSGLHVGCGHQSMRRAPLLLV